MKKTGGTVANHSGRRLEDNVSSILEDRGYQFVKPIRFFPMKMMEQPIYSVQYKIGKDIYGKNRRVDRILYHPKLYPSCLVIQCKWQASSGSVEEKYPFEVLSLQKNKYDTIIILDGEGYSKGAKQWLLNQAGKNNLKYVFNLGEFSKFVSKGRIG